MEKLEDKLIQINLRMPEHGGKGKEVALLPSKNGGKGGKSALLILSTDIIFSYVLL